MSSILFSPGDRPQYAPKYCSFPLPDHLRHICLRKHYPRERQEAARASMVLRQGPLILDALEKPAPEFSYQPQWSQDIVQREKCLG
jgi:hypothetical protein